MITAKQLQLWLERPPLSIDSERSFHHCQTRHALTSLEYACKLAPLKTLNNRNVIVPTVLDDA